MVENKVSNNEGTNYESVCDPNLLSMYWLGGSNWSVTIKQECLAATQEPVETKEHSIINKIVLGVALASVALLGAITIKNSPQLATAVEEINTNSTQEVMIFTTTPTSK
ncbi:MAG: hypothetical protein F6K41_13030 [Symploca sp. SIO3E6]|nr:hypothetical protein [Caldora sp. SIO3E6]